MRIIVFDDNKTQFNKTKQATEVYFLDETTKNNMKYELLPVTVQLNQKSRRKPFLRLQKLCQNAQTQFGKLLELLDDIPHFWCDRLCRYK